jgi:hypothetical protein
VLDLQQYREDQAFGFPLRPLWGRWREVRRREYLCYAAEAGG